MDTAATHVAHDFGDRIRIIAVDPQSAQSHHQFDDAHEVSMGGDRDSTLDAAGYRRIGEWSKEGDHDAARVERMT
ncbi:hypothetical protein HDA32_005678 [Spinactinospora alkalitolerans]|uniref:Uncharacterized protein n=1 Tax=Spinactinospora alkalitolerans TaxID=687207 RepID=A0A852U2V5_9ACTN|nr:hypothetical protein [Spinactinospora alkalitolerans]NYE50558.1 hypothetical protein [Spinactinospora alkalitolerans]